MTTVQAKAKGRERAAPPPYAVGWRDTIFNNRAVARVSLHAAGGSDPARLPGLSAGPGRLAGHDQHDDRPARRVSSASRTTSGCSPIRSSGSPFSILSSTRWSPASSSSRSHVAGAALEPSPAVQGLPARHRAAALDRADRALGDRVLVDLRPAILDHLLVAGRVGADRPIHRLPGRSRHGAGQRDHRQCLAGHPVRRDHAAGGAPDNSALALRGGDDRRGQPVAALPLHHLPDADPDHRGW